MGLRVEVGLALHRSGRNMTSCCMPDPDSWNRVNPSALWQGAGTLGQLETSTPEAQVAM